MKDLSPFFVHLNGVTVSQANSPHKMMRPASITATVGAATPWASGTYAYDGAGNIKAIGSNFYYYDLVSRVVDGTAEYTSGSIHKRQTYGYDLYGNMNRITTVVNGAQTENFLMIPSTATNRLTTGATYDDSGNQTAWGSWLYTFDGLNMMQSNNNGSRTLRYVYTADDERIAVYDATAVKWTWRLRGVDNKVLREYRLQGGTWSWQKDHIYRGSSLLASDEPSIGIRHFALDHLGTPRLITSSTGATVSLHNYYPFGQEATSETQDAEIMKFTGHERDTEFTNALSSIDYMHARYYSVRLGRFLSVDPKLTSGKMGLPQSWNRYSYTRGNPLNYYDPDGRETNPVTGRGGISTQELRWNKHNPNVGKYGKSRDESNWRGGEHNGVDIFAPKGTPLFAPISGTVSTLTDHPKGGNVVFIDTIRDGKTVRIGMAHLDTMSVKDGDKVIEGKTVVGTSGTTGNAQGMPVNEEHVHLTVRIDGELQEPQLHFKLYPTATETDRE